MTRSWAVRAGPSGAGFACPSVSSPDVLSTARALATDRMAAELAQALAGHGIDSLPRKGRTLARLLYDDGVARPFVDVDLFVAPVSELR